MAKRKDKRKYWRSVFSQVMEHYEELKTTSSSPTCSNLYSMSSGGGPKYKAGVRLLPWDFIADVDLAIKEAIPAKDLSWFREQYNSKQLTGSTYSGEGRNYNACEEAVGKMFVFKKIHPVVRYFKTTQ